MFRRSLGPSLGMDRTYNLQVIPESEYTEVCKVLLYFSTVSKSFVQS